jgi:hypothetical protein
VVKACNRRKQAWLRKKVEPKLQNKLGEQQDLF